MSDPFSERLRGAAITLEEATASVWLAGVQAYVGALRSPDLPDLVRLAFQRAALNAADSLRAACNGASDQDDVPEVRPEDEYLLSLLACQAVIDVFGRDSSGLAVQTALLVRSAGFSEWQPAHADVVSEADSAIMRAAAQLYGPGSSPRTPSQTAGARQALEALGDGFEQSTPAELELLKAALTEQAGELNRLRSYAARVSALAEQSQMSLREQMELLWWLVSNHSLTAARAWSEVPAAAAPCVAGLDLGSIVARPPGPRAVNSFLGHALRQSAGEEPKSSVGAASKAIGELELAKHFPEPLEEIADFFPVLAVIHGQKSQAPTSKRRTALALARQTYDEVLLTRHDL
jgi:GTPase-associated system helical domain